MPKVLRSEPHKRLQILLIEARKNAVFTQEKLAAEIGKHQSFIAKYEDGERRLDLVEFLAITTAIGCDPVRILKQLQKS